MNATKRRVLFWLLPLALVACGDPPADLTGAAPSLHRDHDGDGRPTVVVDPSGRHGRPTTIQVGIDLVPAGGRVQVRRGTYHEQVTVSKNDLVIVADEDGEVVVNAHGHDFGFLVLNASGVTIEGFRVEHAHEADIGLNGATSTTIRQNVTAAAGHDGIQLVNSADNLIEHNVVMDNLAANACGINVTAGSERNVVRHNRSVNNEWGIQINGAATRDNLISANWSLRNRGNGIRNVGGASGTIIEENRAFGTGFAPSGLTAPPNAPNTAAGISIASGVGMVVRFNDIQGNTRAGLGVAASITTPIDASCNYWGSRSGPTSSAWPPGTGDAIVVEAGGAMPMFTPFATRSIARADGRHGDDDDRDRRGRCGSEWSAPVL